jgi:Family of unknown function (DUF5996)
VVIGTSRALQVAEWPELPYDAWVDTLDTLHMKLQLIGKIRLALTRREPQWANVPLYLTARGLTTSPMWSGSTGFAIDVDFIDHVVLIALEDGRTERVPLRSRPVAAFYDELMGRLQSLGVSVSIMTTPSEVDNPIPFQQDTVHSTYDPDSAYRFWRLLARVDLVLKEHRGRFRGRVSPVSFWWGTFDLAVARYSGRPVEPPKGADLIHRVGGDAELCCAGFWPGSARFPEPAFYAYAYPKPESIERATIHPDQAAWNPTMGEFILPYEAVRKSRDPRQAILDFAESTFVAGAAAQRWDPLLIKPYE